MPDPGAPRDAVPAPTLDYRTPPATAPARPRPLRRRRANGMVLLAAGAASAACTAVLDHEPLRTNAGTVTAGLILWGLVLRFGSVRVE
jgi:hypothetical protein